VCLACCPHPGGAGGSGHAHRAADTLIAATALRHQATLVTRNLREFSRVPGLQCVTWQGRR
jgi:predicted nucleic acid-binding protein